MKVYNKSMLWFPAVRCIVENNGNVKILGFALNTYSSLNISSRKSEFGAIQQACQRSLGKQYA